VTIIGDSVTMGARATLLDTIPDCYIDAKGSRQLNVGYDLFTELQDAGELREYVVIALGTNTNSSYDTFLTKIIEEMDPGHRLIFVTPFDGRYAGTSSLSSKTTVFMREMADRYDFITIADWNALIRNQAHLLSADKVHMAGQESKTLFANCIAEAIAVASEGPAKG
jgi:hypothetical protein